MHLTRLSVRRQLGQGRVGRTQQANSPAAGRLDGSAGLVSACAPARPPPDGLAPWGRGGGRAKEGRTGAPGRSAGPRPGAGLGLGLGAGGGAGGAGTGPGPGAGVGAGAVGPGEGGGADGLPAPAAPPGKTTALRPARTTTAQTAFFRCKCSHRQPMNHLQRSSMKPPTTQQYTTT